MRFCRKRLCRKIDKSDGRRFAGLASFYPKVIALNHPVLIVGGGLAGLTAARLLHRAGIDFLLLEARDRLGGRILSADATGEASPDGFDLGPSWFWPGMQPGLATLVKDLGLPFFPQNSDGDVVFHRMSREAPQRYRGMGQEPQSMRLVGGTGAIISALAASLPAQSIQLGARVTHVSLGAQEVGVQFVDAGGSAHTKHASHVLFALPPRLLEARVLFSPALDALTIERWRRTPTWMAPHAKFFALYDHAFWRDAGLSGTAQSMVGPLVEIHDATTASGQAALFGFVGVPAGERAAVRRDAIIAASVEQLAQLFGPQAATPRATLFKDWAADPLTATADDKQAGGHQSPDRRPWVNGKWRNYISLAGSETSLSEPGYLAGAVEAAERAVGEIISRLNGFEGRTFAAQSEESRT
ncbi:FAD-binding protein [Ensifer sp. MPMI2T]|nr:FAD-binding protein [Ensifer sp. MPMI2T]